MNLYLIVLILACAADVAVTHRNLRKGGRELNNIPAKLMAKFGFWPTALGTKALIIGLAILINHPAFYAVTIMLHLTAAIYSFMAGRR